MPDFLRIALLTYSTKPRGSVIHTLELARALYQLGHQPCVFALDKDGQGFPQTFPFESHRVPAQAGQAGVEALIRQRIGEFVAFFETVGTDYDIFHAQDCIGANALVELKQRGHIPHLVRTVHHVEAFESPYLQDCQDRSIRLPDQCLCVSQIWQEALWTEYGLRAGRVFNGVDTDRFRPELNGTEAALAQTWGLGNGPVYLTVGGIEPRKNSVRVLGAFAQVLAVYPQAQWVIAGGATLFDYEPYRQAFLRTAETLELGLGQSIQVLGVIADEDLPVLYRLADAFVLPSVKEGWGLVVLEAIASGLPVITSDRQPFTEFLTAREALLVDPDSVEAIAQAMLQVVRPEIQQYLVRNGRAVCDRFTWTHSAQCHLDIYRQLLLTGGRTHA